MYIKSSTSNCINTSAREEAANRRVELLSKCLMRSRKLHRLKYFRQTEVEPLTVCSSTNLLPIQQLQLTMC